MDHRSWPWKKKSSGKSLADPSPAHSARLNHEPDLQRVLAEHAMNSFEPTRQWHQTEEKVRDLNLKLTAAISDCKAKDELVKQHAKVAEEAVSGWEKAKAEAVGSEKQLDVAIQEKISLGRRVAHLDGALKECMRELRRVRTEQEDKIDEAIVKRTREWDKVRTEFEAKLSELSHQLLEERAEKNTVLKSLQECRRRLSELDDSKSTAEAQVKVLQVRAQTLENENSALKFDLHVLNKEIAIRNDEREYTRKGADAANKQHLERAKKIAKLEAECRTLKMLASKSTVQAHKKLETDALGKESSERKKKVYPVKKGGHLRRPTPNGAAEFKSQCGSKESNVFSEKSSAMEEEIRVLRENLLRKEKELQSSKLICAKTANRLSHVEGQLETMKSVPKFSLNNPAVHGDTATILGLEEVPTVVSMSEDSCNGDQLISADAWASALMAELEQSKEKSVSTNATGSAASRKRDLMDDFAEMERLASAVPSSQKPNNVQIKSETTQIFENDMRSYNNSIGGMHDQTDSLEERLLSRERELEEARQNCSHLNRKLSTAEENLVALHSKNSTNEEVLIHLQEKIDTMLEEQYEGNIFEKDLKIQGVVEPSPGVTAKQAAKSAVCKIIRLVGTLAQETGGAPGFSPPNHSPRKARNDTTSDTAINRIVIDGELILDLHSNNVELDLMIHKLVCVSNNLLQGAVDVFSFISELATVLEFVMGLVCRQFSNVLCHNNTKQAAGDWSQRFTTSGAGYKVEELEEETKNMLTPLQSAQNSASVNGEVQDTEELMPTLPMQLESAQRTIRSAEDQIEAMAFSKSVLESHVNATEAKVNQLQQKITTLDTQLHTQNVDHLNTLMECQNFQQQLSVVRKQNLDLSSQLTSVTEAQQFSEDKLAKYVVSIASLESDIKAAEVDKNQLQEKLVKLQSELQFEHERHEEDVMKLQNLQQQLSQGEQSVVELQLQLASTQKSNKIAEAKLADMSSSNKALQSQVKVADTEVKELQERLAALHWRITEERTYHDDAIASFQNQLHHVSINNFQTPSRSAWISSVEVDMPSKLCIEETRTKKEQEIAAATGRLAECQRTIGLLGKQLRALSLTNCFQENVHSPIATKVQTVKYFGPQIEDAHSQVNGIDKGNSVSNLDQPRAENARLKQNFFSLS